MPPDSSIAITSTPSRVTCSRTRTGAGNHRLPRARPAASRRAAEHHAGHARETGIAGGGDEERGTVVSEAFGDRWSHSSSSAATFAHGHLRRLESTTSMERALNDVPAASLLTSRCAARSGHEHEERARLPRPRRRRLQRSRDPLQQGGLAVVSRYGVGRGDRHWSRARTRRDQSHLPKSLM